MSKNQSETSPWERHFHCIPGSLQQQNSLTLHHILQMNTHTSAAIKLQCKYHLYRTNFIYIEPQHWLIIFLSVLITYVSCDCTAVPTLRSSISSLPSFLPGFPQNQDGTSVTPCSYANYLISFFFHDVHALLGKMSWNILIPKIKVYLVIYI